MEDKKINGFVESWDRWLEETDREIAELQEKARFSVEKKKQEVKERQEKFEREQERMEKIKLAEMKKRYDFPIDEEPVRIALERLESIKVDVYRDASNDISFDAVWKSVLEQVDYYEQEEKEWNMLNKITYKGAKNWLKSFAHLCKGNVPDEYKSKEG